MIENKKKILFFVVLLVLIYFAITILLKFPREKKYVGTVFIGSSTKIYINNNDIKISNENDKISNQKVKVIFNNGTVDGYITSTEPDSSGVKYGYVLYDTNGRKISLNSTLVAYTDDMSIKIKEFNKIESTNLTEVYSILKKNNITVSTESKLGYFYITIVDINNDGIDDYVYSIGLIEDKNKFNSLIITKIDDEYFLVDRVESNYDEISNIRLNFFRMIDLNNDDKYEFVVEKSMSEYGPYYYDVYSFDGLTFNKIGGE